MKPDEHKQLADKLIGDLNREIAHMTELDTPQLTMVNGVLQSKPSEPLQKLIRLRDEIAEYFKAKQ